MAKKKYSISESELLMILSDLELVVVSLDRIGSSSDDVQEVKMKAAEFIGNPRMFRRLAKVRRVLSDVFDSGASASAARKLDLKLRRAKYWRESESR